MMRSFQTRLVSSATAVVLLIPCLLIWLACATPFPIESLEKGMTAETVRMKFGEPEAIETKPRDVESSWTYVHEEQAWFPTVIFSSLVLPHCILFTALMPFYGGHPCFGQYVEEKPVVLHFEAEKLVRWEVLAPVPVVSSGYTYRDPFPSTMTFPSKHDIKHHQRGHKHHHGHGC